MHNLNIFSADIFFSTTKNKGSRFKWEAWEVEKTQRTDLFLKGEWDGMRKQALVEKRKESWGSGSNMEEEEGLLLRGSWGGEGYNKWQRRSEPEKLRIELKSYERIASCVFPWSERRMMNRLISQRVKPRCSWLPGSGRPVLIMHPEWSIKPQCCPQK